MFLWCNLLPSFISQTILTASPASQSTRSPTSLGSCESSFCSYNRIHISSHFFLSFSSASIWRLGGDVILTLGGSFVCSAQATWKVPWADTWSHGRSFILKQSHHSWRSFIFKQYHHSSLFLLLPFPYARINGLYCHIIEATVRSSFESHYTITFPIKLDT